MNNNFNVEEETLFKVSNETNNSINEEKLFSSSEESLDYIEPIKPENLGGEVLFASRNDISEESLFHGTHVDEIDGGMGSEVLFGAKVEDIAVLSQTKYEIQGEDIAFSEPVMPNYVTEEVLFSKVVEDEVSTGDYDTAGGIIDNSLIDSLLVESVDKKVYEDKNFVQKMLEADPIILDRYAELKNYILKYKGVKSRISNNYDTFNTGRTQLFKLCTSGKSLKLYLNLPFEDVEPRLKCKYEGDKKAYEQVPTFLRIKSDRAMKNAKYLIEMVATRFNLKENKKFTEVNAIEILKERLV
ncbi:MAG: hypothetical protein J6R88_02095 [Clostridia bacterium]|nr:hypothetical protein [Clostridia bacterium]